MGMDDRVRMYVADTYMTVEPHGSFISVTIEPAIRPSAKGDLCNCHDTPNNERDLLSARSLYHIYLGDKQKGGGGGKGL